MSCKLKILVVFLRLISYIYIYIYVCVCVCVCVFIYIILVLGITSKSICHTGPTTIAEFAVINQEKDFFLSKCCMQSYSFGIFELLSLVIV